MNEILVKVVVPSSNRTLELHLSPTEDTIDSLKALVASETGNDINQMTFWIGTKIVNFPSELSISQCGIKNGDTLTLFLSPQPPKQQKLSPPPPPPAIPSALTNNVVGMDLFRQAFQQVSTTPQSNQQQSQRRGRSEDEEIDPVEFREYVRSDPDFLERLLQNNPTLAEACMSDEQSSIDLIRQILIAQKETRNSARRRDDEELLALQRRLEFNPMDIEAQKQLDERIRQSNVEKNFEYAIEHTPEAFATVTMLFIKVIVNGVQLIAMVDSGAQTSVMSVEFAERCNIMRLVDRNFSGVVRGAGEAEMIGRVHSCTLQIGKQFLPSAFSIVAGSHLDFLLGLDLMKRHQMVIDLASNPNCLKINNESILFLPENECPKMKPIEKEDKNKKQK